MSICFTDGSSLTLSAHTEPVVASFQELSMESLPGRAFDRPSSRQRDYLDFIRKFTARYGVAPAESDIARHFLVSAPSVNQMIKTLERRGFIARERGPTGQAVPRSIRIIGSP
ncbi:MAG TPA: MarR family transcriptional regulator [Longimicrobium sp.]